MNKIIKKEEYLFCKTNTQCSNTSSILFTNSSFHSYFRNIRFGDYFVKVDSPLYLEKIDHSFKIDGVTIGDLFEDKNNTCNFISSLKHKFPRADGFYCCHPFDGDIAYGIIVSTDKCSNISLKEAKEIEDKKIYKNNYSKEKSNSFSYINNTMISQ